MSSSHLFCQDWLAPIARTRIIQLRSRPTPCSYVMKFNGCTTRFNIYTCFHACSLELKELQFHEILVLTKIYCFPDCPCTIEGWASRYNKNWEEWKRKRWRKMRLSTILTICHADSQAATTRQKQKMKMKFKKEKRPYRVVRILANRWFGNSDNRAHAGLSEFL